MSIIDLMSSDLHFERSLLDELCRNAEWYYHQFRLDGRPIEAPSEELKLVQAWIYDFVRTETDSLPSYVTAYETGSNIIKNAQIHQNASHLLTLDIESFFHSWHRQALRDYFTSLANTKPSLDMTSRDIEMLTSFCTVRGHLPMGSPCSPALANRLMLPCDRQIIDSLGGGMVYSRYADDMAISSNTHIDVDETVKKAEDILKGFGLKLNQKKTRCMGKGDRRRIAGIYISPEGQLSIGSARRRQLKELIYRHLVSEEGKEIISAHRLMGLITFCRQIEPAFVARVISKYSNYGRAARVPGGLMELLMQEAIVEDKLRQQELKEERDTRRRMRLDHMADDEGLPFD